MFHKKTLLDLLPEVRGQYLVNEPMSRHTWFAVGGPAEIMFLPSDLEDLSNFLKRKPYNLPLSIVGGGSNLLVRDGGIPGVVIKLDTPFFRKTKVVDNTLICGAGLKNIDLRKVLLRHGLGGLEFLCSIPGTIGGSLRTNAGCFGKSVKDVLLNVQIMDSQGNTYQIDPADLQLSYRNSLFPDDWIITAVTFKTEKAAPESIKQILEEHKKYRKANQPYNEKTAGSTFKNPEGLRAWELIKKSGCADMSIGGAKVSEKHCNFLINTGTATAEDIERLGDAIVEAVRRKTSLTLVWEIKKIGVGK